MNSNDLIGFQFNEEQSVVIQILSQFIESNFLCPKINVSRNNIQHLDNEQKQLLSNYPRFLLSGSAGTGKTSIITYVILASWCNKLPVTSSPKYILCAPTNKAKDVLMNKYINLRDRFLKTINSNPELKNNITDIKKKTTTLIEFKTLSQVLGINITINKDGEQEFTKGNLDKITKKYNKKEYSRTTIIIDECSMIDINAIRKCQAITKPVIYLGDPCQLPPVNEDFSEVFHLPDFDTELVFFNLVQVMRSVDKITDCCNYMRDIILKSEDDKVCFKHIHKTYASPKNKLIRFYNKKPQSWLKRYVERCLSKSIPNDMGICWTNSRCSSLNNKVREILYTTQNNLTGENAINVTVPYLMDNEKIIVKNTYYNYDSKCYTSLILRVNSFTNTEYKPPSLLEWVKMGIYNYNAMVLKNNPQDSNDVNDNIDDNELLNLGLLLETDIEAKRTEEKNKGTLFQFGFNNKNVSRTDNTNSVESEKDKELENLKRKQEFCKVIRTKFYSQHNYYENTKEWYDKKEKYVNIPESVSRNDIFIKASNIFTNNNDLNESIDTQYSKIHKDITKMGFGIPVEKMHCTICEFFAPYILELIRNKDHTAIQFLKLTQNLKLGCNLCQGTDNLGNKYEFSILDEYSKETYDILKTKAKTLLSFCTNMRINLNTSQINKLKKLLESDQLEALRFALLSSSNTVNVSNIKSIPYALLFGHFWNHVFVDPIMDWDYGYFITTHKSQGSDYDEVFVDGSNLLKNSKKTEKDKLIYTGLSRAKSRLNVYL